MELWHIWMIVAIILFTIEIFSSAFVAICLAIGAVFAVAGASLGLNLSFQFVLFAVGSLLSFFYARPVMMKYFNKEEIKTNADALVGKIAKVSVTIDNRLNQGRVMIDGDDWRAVSADDSVILEGERVEILRLESITLIVKKL